MENSIYHSNIIYNNLKQLNLCRIYSQTYIKHILAIILSVFSVSFKGKTVNFEQSGSCHRTTTAHFLNRGKWDDSRLEDTLKQTVVDIIYREAAITGKPVFCIVDDTISSHTKPSSKALHPIEDAYFHQSHLKRKQDYGHQAVAVMLSCNGLFLITPLSCMTSQNQKLTLYVKLRKNCLCRRSSRISCVTAGTQQEN